MKRWILLGLVLLLLSCYSYASLSGQDRELDAPPGHASASTTLAHEGSERDSDSFTLIVLPDTQGYADVRHKETQKHWPDIGDQRSCFFQQTEWIKQNKQKLNIAMAVHVGNITQTDHDAEWKIADTAFKVLDDHVPYVVCSGNHDMGYLPQNRGTSHSRDSRSNVYFAPARFINNPLYRPHFGVDAKQHFREDGEIGNYYLFLNAGGMQFLLITLEFKPRDESLAWANRVVSQHPDCRTIVVTHAYLTSKPGQRSSTDKYKVQGNSGEEIWKKFVSQHRNIFMVLSGHAMENRLTSKGKHRNLVHQVQADYWYWDIPKIKAGSGFLRIMTFYPGKNKIEVQTYSPVLDEFLTRPKSSFSLDYVMGESAN
ncbi:metallophosphoesterase [Rosistilla oblonga]|uniref:metallophosphoesterase n=1 Tax=Rosistilla oblonga TaxID=2527990 RepID=UPI003A987CCE